MIGDRERALAPVLARLVDQSRVVRAGPPRCWSASASSNCRATPARRCAGRRTNTSLSLDMFPDVASNHAAKGWLEAERGSVAAGARRRSNKATAVTPNYAFPWVVKGVLSAREGKFADAVEMWKKARSHRALLPQYRSAHC